MATVNEKNATELANATKYPPITGPSTVRRSGTIGQLAAALCAAQAEMDNPHKTKQNPHLKNWYADLPAVLKAVLPPLIKHKLAVTQLPCEIDGEAAITTILLHESGEWVETTVKIRAVKNDPQSVGSAQTYARRYALISICGVAADDDDDGHAASQKAGNHAPQHHAQPAKTLAQECLAAIKAAGARNEIVPIYRQYEADLKAGKFTPGEQTILDAAFKDFGAKFPAAPAKA